jgi:hypothetical protein
MSKPARKPQVTEPETDQSSAEAGQFLREFRRRMAEQGLIVRMANAQPDWEPAITLDMPADELSAMVVRLRQGNA